MIHIPLPDDFNLPAMRMVRQRYDLPAEVDVSVEIDREFNRIKDALDLSHGKRVAVGVGRRGIANLARIVREVVKKSVVCLKCSASVWVTIPVQNTITGRQSPAVSMKSYTQPAERF